MEQTKKTPIWLYAFAVFITQMDGGAISTLLPAISKGYQISSVSASWVAGIYTLGLVIGTPIFSNLSDLYGTKKIFLIELILWFIGSLITLLAPNFIPMLIGRLVQALGDGGIIVLSMNAVLREAKKNKQGRKVSIIGVISGMSAIFGPIFAGMTLGIFKDWRMFYGLLLPVLVVLFLLSWRFLDNIPGQAGKRTDYLGTLTFTLALSSFMLALTFAQHFGTYRFLILGLLVIGLVSARLFIQVERRLDQTHLSFLPLHLLKKPAYVLTILLGALGGMLFSVFVYIPTFVHTIFGLPMRLSGMVLVGTGMGSVVGSYLGGLLVDKRGFKSTLLFSCMIIGVTSMLIAITISSLRAFMGFSFVFGIGLGSLMSAPLQVIAGRLADKDDHVQAIGGLSTMKKIGITIAPLLFATVLQLSAINGVMGIASFRNMFIMIIFIAVACAFVTLKIPFEGRISDRAYK